MRLPARRGVAASASCDAFPDCCSVSAGAQRGEQAALGDGCLNSSAETASVRVDARGRRGVPTTRASLDLVRPPGENGGALSGPAGPSGRTSTVPRRRQLRA